MVGLNISGSVLRTDAAPGGIISFELARDEGAVRAILDSWEDKAEEQAKISAGFNLGLDFLFIPAYSTTIALGIIWLTVLLFSRPWITKLALFLAWGQWIAAALDVIENVALYQMLLEGPSTFLAQLASTCAMVKFALVILGLVYALGASLVWFIRRFS
jgi:hypothetical protein